MEYGMEILHAVSQTNMATSTLCQQSYEKILDAFRSEVRLIRASRVV